MNIDLKIFKYTICIVFGVNKYNGINIKLTYTPSLGLTKGYSCLLNLQKNIGRL